MSVIVGELNAELEAIEQRLAELEQRDRFLRDAPNRQGASSDHAGRDLTELERTVATLKARQREIVSQLEQPG